MKFLADQDVYATTIGFLSGLGHDVVRVAQLGLAQAEVDGNPMLMATPTSACP